MTTRCCVRVRPYPYIQCYTSVICRFHTLCHHRPQSSTGCERHSCSSITCADAGIGGFRADFRPVLHLRFPPLSTGKIFACGHVAESTTDDSELLSAAPITSRAEAIITAPPHIRPSVPSTLQPGPDTRWPRREWQVAHGRNSDIAANCVSALQRSRLLRVSASQYAGDHRNASDGVAERPK